MPKDFGFPNADRKLDVSDFKPSQESQHDTADEQVKADRAAERVGFQSRETVERVARIRKPSQPFDQAFVRAPIDVINRFKIFCNETGLSYGEALDELMRRAGK
jgi:hypothetical protein